MAIITEMLLDINAEIFLYIAENFCVTLEALCDEAPRFCWGLYNPNDIYRKEILDDKMKRVKDFDTLTNQ